MIYVLILALVLIVIYILGCVLAYGRGLAQIYEIVNKSHVISKDSVKPNLKEFYLNNENIKEGIRKTPTKEITNEMDYFFWRMVWLSWAGWLILYDRDAKYNYKWFI